MGRGIRRMQRTILFALRTREHCTPWPFTSDLTIEALTNIATETADSVLFVPGMLVQNSRKPSDVVTKEGESNAKRRAWDTYRTLIEARPSKQRHQTRALGLSC